jgi:hypothetical protein
MKFLNDIYCSPSNFIFVLLFSFPVVPANGNFSEEVAYVKPQDTNSIELQSDEVQSQMAKKNRNHTPQSEY